MEGPSLNDLGSAGPVLALLAVMSVVSLAVIVARLLALRGVASGAERRAEGFAALEAGQGADAFAAGQAPADRVARRAAEMLMRGAGPAAVEAELTGLGNEEAAGMARGLRLLELVGMIAPLLGLLGTVLGMIQSFRSLELAAGSANASILAGGIWQALLTTAAGLVVAIPALVGAAIVAARVEAGTRAIERVIARAGAMAASVGTGADSGSAKVWSPSAGGPASGTPAGTAAGTATRTAAGTAAGMAAGTAGGTGATSDAAGGTVAAGAVRDP